MVKLSKLRTEKMTYSANVVFKDKVLTQKEAKEMVRTSLENMIGGGFAAKTNYGNVSLTNGKIIASASLENGIITTKVIKVK